MSKNVQKTSENKELTSQQLKAIELLVDYDNNMTYGDIASEVGVSERTLWEWRNRNDAFIEKKKELSERGLREKIDCINRALVNGAAEGNPRLIKLYYERLGMYVDKKEISGPNGGPIETKQEYDLSDLEDEELRLLEKINRKIEGS